jgi:subfamily B ATP-binding cassette protein MsbA
VVILSGGRVKKQAPFAALASLSIDELYQHESIE